MHVEADALSRLSDAQKAGLTAKPDRPAGLVDHILSQMPLVTSLRRTSFGNNVRRAGSSFPPRPYCHFALQHGPAPNIAHSSFASSESPLLGGGTWVTSSASAELQTGAQLTFCCFAFLLFDWVRTALRAAYQGSFTSVTQRSFASVTQRSFASVTQTRQSLQP
jgi:hypothetical protein